MAALLIAQVRPVLADDSAQRWYAAEHAEAGEAIYLAYCASCHGAEGGGAPQWWELERDGNRLAPPLNGTGHGWHHPLRQLYAMIHDGIPPGMPRWKGILDRGEILAVIAFFQTWWPDEVYAAWDRMNRNASSAGR
jgi:mono/diheme cytochrome c family protein